MLAAPKRQPKKSILKKAISYFVQGMLILAPIAISIWAIVAMFNFLDELLPQLLGTTRQIVQDSNGDGVLEIKTVKGLPKGIGFVIIVSLIIFIGYISSFFVVGRFVDFFERILEKTPGVKFIYSSIKDFFEAFAGDKKKFDKAVLANVFGDNVWIVGFLTDEEMQKFELGAEQVGVYVPQAYNFAGQLYIMPREKIKYIENITSGEAMKYAVTGGVVDLDEERKSENEISE